MLGKIFCTIGLISKIWSIVLLRAVGALLFHMLSQICSCQGHGLFLIIVLSCCLVPR